VGLSVPFGPGPNAKFLGTPSIQGSTTPTFSLGTLNTQGFMMTMIQPISTTYVLNKWNEGYNPEMLLYLFVKSIKFPDDGDIPNGLRIHLNNPDDQIAMQDFNKLVRNLVAMGHVDMKSLMVLDPLGQPVPLGQTISTAMPPSPKPATGASATGVEQTTVASDFSIFTTINSLADGQLHVGNESACPSYLKGQCGKTPLSPFAQFYKEYPAQVVLCVNTDHDKFDDHKITPVSETEAVKEVEAQIAVDNAQLAVDSAENII
jgi:hypothetical protein